MAILVLCGLFLRDNGNRIAVAFRMQSIGTDRGLGSDLTVS